MIKRTGGRDVERERILKEGEGSFRRRRRSIRTTREGRERYAKDSGGGIG